MHILKTNNIHFGTTTLSKMQTEPTKEKLPKISYTDAIMSSLADDGEDEFISEEEKLWQEYMKHFNPDLYEHYD